MPFCRATSRMVSSWRPLRSRPSIFSVLTVGDGSHAVSPAELRAADSGRTLVIFNMGPVLLGERAQRADHRIRRRLPQAAQAGVLQQVAEFFQHLHVLRRGVHVARSPSQNAVHLVRSDAAWNALAARLGHAEVHEVFGHVDHAGAFVHHDHAARAHDRPRACQRFIIHRHVEAIGRQAAARRSARLHRLELAALRNPAADFEDHLAQGDSHRNFNQAGVLDPPSQGKDFRAFALLGADTGIPLAAVADDGRDIGEGLYVVDERRLPEQPFHRRIRRPRTRRPALPFHRSDQRGLFAADESTSTQTLRSMRKLNRVPQIFEPSNPMRSACRIALRSRLMASGYSART